MDASSKTSPQTSLFQVYLRLRPPISPFQTTAERCLAVEAPLHNEGINFPRHITLQPPLDSRKRAVEKFAFTKVFEEDAQQLDVFEGAGVVPLVEGVLTEGRDGLIATLGVTGSGKV